MGVLEFRAPASSRTTQLFFSWKKPSHFPRRKAYLSDMTAIYTTLAGALEVSSPIGLHPYKHSRHSCTLQAWSKQSAT